MDSRPNQKNQIRFFSQKRPTWQTSTKHLTYIIQYSEEKNILYGHFSHSIFHHIFLILSTLYKIKKTLSLRVFDIHAIKKVGCAIHATKKLDGASMPSRDFF